MKPLRTLQVVTEVRNHGEKEGAKQLLADMLAHETPADSSPMRPAHPRGNTALPCNSGTDSMRMYRGRRSVGPRPAHKLEHLPPTSQLLFDETEPLSNSQQLSNGQPYLQSWCWLHVASRQCELRLTPHRPIRPRRRKSLVQILPRVQVQPQRRQVRPQR